MADEPPQQCLQEEHDWASLDEHYSGPEEDLRGNPVRRCRRCGRTEVQAGRWETVMDFTEDESRKMMTAHRRGDRDEVNRIARAGAERAGWDGWVNADPEP